MHKLYKERWTNYAFNQLLCPEKQDKILLISYPIFTQIEPEFNFNLSFAYIAINPTNVRVNLRTTRGAHRAKPTPRVY
jgi:hypothetical protein